MGTPIDQRAKAEMDHFDALPEVLRDTLNYSEVGLARRDIDKILAAGAPPPELARRFKAYCKRLAALPPEQRGWP